LEIIQVPFLKLLIKVARATKMVALDVGNKGNAFDNIEGFDKRKAHSFRKNYGQ